MRTEDRVASASAAPAADMTAVAVMLVVGVPVTAWMLRWQRRRAVSAPFLVDLSTVIGASRLLREVGDTRQHARLDRCVARWLRLRLLVGRRRSSTDTAPMRIPRQLLLRIFRLLDRCTVTTETDRRQRHALLALFGVMLLDTLPVRGRRTAQIPRPDRRGGDQPGARPAY